MSTQQALIEDAYASFGILDEETGLEPTQLRRGLREVHRLVERLYDDGVPMPYYLSDNLSDDTGVSAADEECLIVNVALKLMSTYANDRQPSATLINTAKNSIRTLRNRKSARPRRVHPTTLPRGSAKGNIAGYYSPTFYSNQGRYRVLLSNNDPMFDGDGNPLYFEHETFS